MKLVTCFVFAMVSLSATAARVDQKVVISKAPYFTFGDASGKFVTFKDGFSCGLFKRVDGKTELRVKTAKSDGCGYLQGHLRNRTVSNMAAELLNGTKDSKLECSSSTGVTTKETCELKIGATHADLTAEVICAKTGDDLNTQCDLMALCRSQAVTYLSAGDATEDVEVTPGKNGKVSKAEALDALDNSIRQMGCTK